jgi:hypothetical protein
MEQLIQQQTFTAVHSNRWQNDRLTADYYRRVNTFAGKYIYSLNYNWTLCVLMANMLRNVHLTVGNGCALNAELDNRIANFADSNVDIVDQNVGVHKVNGDVHKSIWESHKPIGEVHKQVGESHKPIGEVHKQAGESHKPIGEVHKQAGESHKSIMKNVISWFYNIYGKFFINFLKMIEYGFIS